MVAHRKNFNLRLGPWAILFVQPHIYASPPFHPVRGRATHKFALKEVAYLKCTGRHGRRRPLCRRNLSVSPSPCMSAKGWALRKQPQSSCFTQMRKPRSVFGAVGRLKLSRVMKALFSIELQVKSRQATRVMSAELSRL